MLSAKELVGHGRPTRFIAVDPGKSTGLLYWDDGTWNMSTVSLAELPKNLLGIAHVDFVVCESYSLTGGNRRNDPSMPAPQGIGMARMACFAQDVPLYMIHRGAKRAGHQALDADGMAAWQQARNDHERDVVDLGGFVLREALR